jgi:hypothetical protein
MLAQDLARFKLPEYTELLIHPDHGIHSSGALRLLRMRRRFRPFRSLMQAGSGQQ